MVYIHFKGMPLFGAIWWILASINSQDEMYMLKWAFQEFWLGKVSLLWEVT